MQYGSWTLIEKLNWRRWRCRCICGQERLVFATMLKEGRSQSCGCQRRNHVTHGLSHLREFRVWCGMRQRCTNPRCRAFPDYGGRGITICEGWQSFETFLADMGRAPTAQHSIDRRDNDGPYAPENCHWVTREDQNRNTRRNKQITHDGRTQTIPEWAHETGIPVKVIEQRLRRDQWSVHRALTTALRS